ncbi:MAG: OmpA family protein [Bacteroidia bacterium]|nr:OmpA family protein [Bacteroidia bacterium]
MASLLVSSCVSSKKYKLSQSQLAATEQMVKARNTSITGLESQLAGFKAQVATLTSDTAQLGTQIRKISQEKATLQRTSSSNQQQLSAELQQKQLEIDRAQTLLTQKLKELAEKEALLATQTQKINELNDQIDRQKEATDNLRASIEEALVNFSAEELTVENRNGKIYVSMAEKLLFKSGSAAVDPKGVTALEQLAAVLAKKPDISVMIEGHTDNIPIKTARFDDNWDLSVIRATAVSRILMKKGVPAERITASGRGEFFPIAANDTPEGRSKNRRTEIILSPKLDVLYELLRP